MSNYSMSYMHLTLFLLTFLTSSYELRCQWENVFYEVVQASHSVELLQVTLPLLCHDQSWSVLLRLQQQLLLPIPKGAVTDTHAKQTHTHTDK